MCIRDRVHPEFQLAESADRPTAEHEKYIVRFSSDTRDYDLVRNSVLQTHGGTLAFQFARLFGGKGFIGWFTPAQAERLAGHPKIHSIEKDTAYSFDGTRSVSQAGQWGLDRIDDRGSMDDTYQYDWDGSGVHVYVIDSGIDSVRTQFSGRIGAGKDFNSHPAYSDCIGHGTAVAGIGVGSTDGVATGATIHSVKVSHCLPEQSADFYVGLEWVLNNASTPAVVNMSGTPDTDNVRDAINDLYDDGIFVVVSAGNDSENANASRSCTAYGSFVVAAANSAGDLSSYSNYGTTVDILAPGDSIRTAQPGTDSPVLKTGTSFAAPFVAGTAALILDLDPNLTPAEIRAILIGSATTGLANPASLNNTPNRTVYAPHLGASDVDGNDVGWEGYFTYSVDDPFGGDGSYTYLWEYSTDEENWTTVGTSQYYTRYVSWDDPNFFLRFTLTSGVGIFSPGVRPVFCCWNEDEC